MGLPVMLIVIVAGAVVYGFLNGYKDAASIAAVVISSRAMRARYALAVVALAEFCGPFLFGVAVAATIGKGLIVEAVVTPPFILASLGSAIIWNLCMILLGLPASSTHALIGALLGAALASAGPEAIIVSGVLKVLAALLLSPAIGFVLSYVLLKLVFVFSQGASPKINTTFRRLQVLMAVMLGLSHGSNDAQKSIGIITMGLVATGYSTTFEVPLWVVFAGAGALSVGALLGGERVMRTVGGRIFRIRPVHGFAAQMAASIIVVGANVSGQPISTTQVISGTVMGAGSSDRLSKVRWATAGNIALSWLVTLPAGALIAGILWHVLAYFGGTG